MTYHTILKNSKDYYSAMSSARDIADKINDVINKGKETKENEVFPYRYEVAKSPIIKAQDIDLNNLILVFSS